CDTSTGLCSNPTQADGTFCSDGDLCTRTDTCQSGNCVGGNSVTCTQPTAQCQVAGTCNPGTGLCSPITMAADGTPCNDGLQCTFNGTCSAGACGGTVVVCPMVNGAVGTCTPINGACVYDQ